MIHGETDAEILDALVTDAGLAALDESWESVFRTTASR